MSKEPLGPVVRDGDDDWADAVNWAVYATIQAEEFGSPRTTSIAAGSDDPEIQRFLGGGGRGRAPFDAGLGLPDDFAVQVVTRSATTGRSTTGTSAKAPRSSCRATSTRSGPTAACSTRRRTARPIGLRGGGSGAAPHVFRDRRDADDDPQAALLAQRARAARRRSRRSSSSPSSAFCSSCSTTSSTTSNACGIPTGFDYLSQPAGFPSRTPTSARRRACATRSSSASGTRHGRRSSASSSRRSSASWSASRGCRRTGSFASRGASTSRRSATSRCS